MYVGAIFGEERRDQNFRAQEINSQGDCFTEIFPSCRYFSHEPCATARWQVFMRLSGRPYSLLGVWPRLLVHKVSSVVVTYFIN